MSIFNRQIFLAASKLIYGSIIVTAVLLFSCPTLAKGDVVNVYNWANYMPTSILRQFEKETGIHVNYSVYDSNETLYAKLRANVHSGYDVIVPSSYYVNRMQKAGILHKLDKSKLPNFKNMNPNLLHQVFDPNNDYSVPYMWGTTGIVVNDKYISPNSLTRWSDFWKPEYKNQLMLLDDMREVFSVALITLGYSVNDSNPDHIKQAYQKLLQLMPNIKLFNSDAIQNILIDEDVRIGMMWNGDYFQASSENKNLKYTFPKDGFVYWIDTLAIPKYAPHLQNAYKFINFIMRPDIAAQITIAEGFSSPNINAPAYMPKELRENKILNPDSEVLKRGQLQTDVGNFEEIYEKYWELLKIGG